MPISGNDSLLMTHNSLLMRFYLGARRRMEQRGVRGNPTTTDEQGGLKVLSAQCSTKQNLEQTGKFYTLYSHVLTCKNWEN